MKEYYGGSSVRGGQRKLSANSWKEFVARYFNVPHVLKFPRAEFHEWPIKKQREKKDGPYVTACTFKNGTTDRNDENAVLLSCICLDIDFPDEEARAEGYLDFSTAFFEAPESVLAALHPYNCIVYETVSSREGCRSLRIIVDIVPSPLELKYTFVRHIADLLGIVVDKWKGFRESKVISQPMYRPVQFQDEEFTAVLASRTNGTCMDELDLPAETVEDIEREYAYRSDVSGSDLAHCPIQELRPVDVHEALFSIDPDCDYRMWTAVIAALRHQFRNEEDAAQAFEMALEWSSRGTKFQGEEDVYAKWKSFKPDATGKVPVTIRTLFRYAIEAGWDNKKLSKKVTANVVEWIEACEDPDELMEEGSQRIAAMPFKNDVVEESLAVKLKARLQALTNETLDKRTIKAAIRKARRKRMAEETDDNRPAWMRPWVYVTSRNVFRHMTNGVELSPAAFDNTFSVEMMNVTVDGEAPANGKPTILPKDYALNLKGLPRVDGSTYDPRFGGDEPFFEWEGRKYLNEYMPSTIPAEDPENSVKAGKIWNKHMLVLTGDPVLAALMTDFVAFTIQNPGVLVPWAPLIQSAEGAGKTLLSEVIGAAIGFPNSKCVNPHAIKSNYNDWAFFCLFLIIEEIKMPGANRSELMNSIKDVISNERVTLVQKFQDVRVCLNLANKIAFTNYHDALHLEESDRRWLPIKSPLQTKAQVVALTNSGHFVKFAKLKKFGGALRHFFLNHKVSADFPVKGPPPQTSYRDEMIAESKNPLQVEIEELIEDPNQPWIGDDVIHTQHLLETLSTQNTQRNHKPSHYLHRLGFVLYKSGTQDKFRINGGARTSVWIHPDFYDPTLGKAEELLKLRQTEEDHDGF